MRAISVRPARVRRNSTSLTLISNVAVGSYVGLALAPAAPSAESTGRDLRACANTGSPAAPNAVMFIRKSRRPRGYLSMRTSLQNDPSSAEPQSPLSDTWRDAGKRRLAQRRAAAGYGNLTGQLDMPNPGDELHHFGWNACSSCLCPYAPHPHMERRYLIVPGIESSRTHIIDTKPDPRKPTLVKVIDADTLAARTGYSA